MTLQPEDIHEQPLDFPNDGEVSEARNPMSSSVLATLQGLFFLVNGLWPIFHIDSFVYVTGPKTDIWLVKTVGLLIATVGAALLVAVYDRAVPRSIKVMASLSSIFLMTVDVYYVVAGTIRPVYLVDATIEIFFILCWVLTTTWANKKLRKKFNPVIIPDPAALGDKAEICGPVSLDTDAAKRP